MPEKVNIPIEVTGAEQAKAQLEDVSAAMLGVRQAAAGGAGGAARGRAVYTDINAALGMQGGAVQKTQELAGATQKAAGGLEEITTHGKRAAASILGLFNPALGMGVHLVMNLFESLTKASRALFGMVAIGAALGAITLIFNKIAEGARRAEEALERMSAARDRITQRKLELRETMAEKLKDLGIISAPAAERATERAHEQMKAGMPREWAEFGALAQEAGGMPAAQAIGAAVKLGLPAQLEAKTIAQTLGQMRALPPEEAAQAYAAWQAALTPAPESEAGKMRAIAQLKEAGQLSDQEEKAMKLLARGAEPEEIFWGPKWRERFWGSRRERYAEYEQSLGDRRTRMLRESIGGRLLGELWAQVENEATRIPTGGGPVIIRYQYVAVQQVVDDRRRGVSGLDGDEN